MVYGQVSLPVSYFLGGWLNELYGWRTTFALLGLPGLALAGLAWFTLREPRRAVLASPAAFRARAADVSTQPRMIEVAVILWRSNAFRHLLLCIAITTFFSQGIAKWQPTFFMRSFGMQSGELGTWLALVLGCSGLVGAYIGGELAARYAVNDERLQLKAIALLYCVIALIKASTYLSENKYVALGLLGLHAFAAAATTGPLYATIQTLVPERMRAVAISTILLFSNLVGMGLGPLAAGLLSDVLHPHFADESLRYALLALCPGYLWAARHMRQASQSIVRDSERMNSRVPNIQS
jgi:predicted MFS family arabinose efflux permease